MNTSSRRTRFGHAAMHLLLSCCVVIFLFPFYWLIVSSFKPVHDIFSVPFGWWPEKWTTQHYEEGWRYMRSVTFTDVYLNTLYVTTVSVLATVFTSTLVAYGFARIRFAGRNVLFIALLSTMMLPTQVTLVPTYLIYDRLHLIDTYASLYIGAFFGGGAFFIFLIRQFMMGLPYELDESARMDGASLFRIYWNIILPLCSPVIITVVILSFSWTYNDFFSPLIFIRSLDKFTVPIAINTFMDEAGSGKIGSAIAMTTVSIVPLLLVFFLAQKRFMEGIATTGLKG